ncbi:basal-body rod modification protein FlgD [bacterium BMS3Abin03]|nr:basal-body rod modification protein FlgD [bacterium BMS3Abin03]
MINGINPTNQNPVADFQANSTIMGKDDFLQLLVTQLRYQDPLSPMDGTKFASQLAQFSSLEQLSNLNQAVQMSIDGNYYLSQSINNTLTATLIGKNVKLAGGTIVKNGQTNVKLGYTLPNSASSVEVNVKDENGNIVKTFDAPPSKTGDSKLLWDFTDNNGSKLPDGTYTFEVIAKNDSGDDMTATLFKWGKIDGIRFSEKGTTLVVDGNEYLLSDILEILDTVDDNSGGIKHAGS